VSWPIQVTRAGGPRGPTCPVPPPSVLTRRLWCTFSRRDRPCLLAPQRGRGCRDDGYRVEGRLALPTHASRRRGGSLPMIDRIGEGAWLVPIGQSGLWCSTSQRAVTLRECRVDGDRHSDLQSKPTLGLMSHIRDLSRDARSRTLMDGSAVASLCGSNPHM